MSHEQPMEAGCYIDAEWVSTPATFAPNPATGDAELFGVRRGGAREGEGLPQLWS